MTSALVSIIITFYNQENYVNHTLQSVLDQTYQDWECIIVDDGSSDKSASLIKDFIKTDSRFKYIYQENQGVSAARNAGFKLASGNYINFLDGDDTIMPKKIEKQVSHFNANRDSFVSITDHNHYKVAKGSFEYYKFIPIESYPLLQILYGWHNGVSFPLHAALYKREIWGYEELPFVSNYNGRAEDWIFNVLIALKQKKYIFLDEVLCTYHHSSTNFTASKLDSEVSYLMAAEFIKNSLEIPDKEKFFETVLRRALNRYAESKRAEFLMNSGSWRLGNKIASPYLKLKRWLELYPK